MVNFYRVGCTLFTNYQSCTPCAAKKLIWCARREGRFTKPFKVIYDGWNEMDTKFTSSLTFYLVKTFFVCLRILALPTIMSLKQMYCGYLSTCVRDGEKMFRLNQWIYIEVNIVKWSIMMYFHWFLETVWFVVESFPIVLGA